MCLLFVNNGLTGNIIQAFCWMLVHSLWQGLVFTIITGLVMMATKKSSSQSRYAAVSVLFFLFITVCAATFVWQLGLNGQAATLKYAAGGVSGLQPALKIFSNYFSANASLIVMLWFIIFCAKCVRMAGSLVYSQRVRHHKIHEPSVIWRDKIAGLCNSLHIKRTVQLLESEIVKIPVVIGHLKPIIFIPLGLLNSLPAGEVEAVLLHELAHIRRNDYFVNFIQVIAENIFFFNPALLWMSSLLREERENCCDDVALNQIKNKKQFIQALISFKEHALHTTKYSTAFPAKKNQLLQRVARIVHNKNKTLSAAERVFLLASFLLLAVLSVAISSGQVNVIAVPPLVKAAVAAAPAFPAQTASHAVIAPSNKIANTTKREDSRGVAISQAGSVAQIAQRVKTETVVIANKTIVDDTKEAAVPDEESIAKTNDDEVAARQQAEQDRQQAIRDRQQAELDRIQAEEDRKQALADQEQAKKDQAQAEIDRKEADIDRQEALKEQQALKELQGAMKNKQAAIHQPKQH